MYDHMVIRDTVGVKYFDSNNIVCLGISIKTSHHLLRFAQGVDILNKCVSPISDRQLLIRTNSSV